MNFLEKSSGAIYTTEALIPKGLPVDNLLIMKKAGYYPIEYQHQTIIDKWTQKEEALPLEFNETDNMYYQRYELVPLDEKTLASNLSYLKDKVIKHINSETSNKILAGFYYNVEVFISYDEFDQINFINTSHLFLTNQIESTEWKSYKDSSKKELHLLQLNKDEFFNIYNFAISNKNQILASGEKIKNSIDSIESIHELRLYCINNIQIDIINS